MKKPKAKWQAYARAELEIRGWTSEDLAKAIGKSYEVTRKAMSDDSMPNVRKKICECLGIAED